MPNRRATIERALAATARAESRATRSLARIYARARREMLAELLDLWPTDRDPTPDEALRIVRNQELLARVERRLLELQRDAGDTIEDAITAQGDMAHAQIGREIDLLPKQLRADIGAFTRFDQRLIERYIPIVTEQLQGQTAMTKTLITRELQSGLLQGQDFPTLARRILRATSPGEGPAVWRNGELSALRLTRRVVIEANNASRQEFIRRASESVQGIQKQLVAAIGARTTQTCLRAHGQIQPVDEPYVLTGQPRFARKMMTPGFHWGCRSASAMYHPAFEDGAMNTATMKREARREMGQR